MARDPYDILGVPRDAGDEEIRRAYRRLAKQEHPDADGGDENYFCRLNDAYESIRTPERRGAHSREDARGGPSFRTRSPERRRGGFGFGAGPGSGRGPGRGRGPGSGPGRGPGRGVASVFGGDLFRIFEQVFGVGHRGRHYRIELRLTPTEARRGTSRELELTDGAHRIDVPPGVRHGDVLSFTETTSAGARLSVDVEVVVRPGAR
jgi:curved DNA-binding protein CbpA